jgi:hypothetical protein
MPLSGQAKTDYQREYMRKRRALGSNTGVTIRPKSVRPEQVGLVRPKGVSDNQWAYIQMKAENE